MKTLKTIGLFFMLALAPVLCFAQDTNTISPAQLSELDQGINSVIPLVPPAWRGQLIALIALVSLAGHIGRVLTGWRTGGLFGALGGLLAGTNTPNTPDDPASRAALRPLLRPGGLPIKGAAILLFAGMGFAILATGCANTQLVNHTVVNGMDAGVAVPIPGTGGASILAMTLKAGYIRNTTAAIPTSTNRMYSASVALADDSEGSAVVNGNSGTSNNASITGGSKERFLATWGDTAAESSQGTNAIRSTRLNGFNGYNAKPAAITTNAPAK
jgi:cytochrome c5